MEQAPTLVIAPAPSRAWLTAGAIALATAGGVFALPFLFPPTHPSLSASYSSGFNNRVAAVAAVLISLVSFGIAWRSSPARPQLSAEAPGPIPPRVLRTALAVCAIFNLGLGTLLTATLTDYNDNMYFLEYMDEVTLYHLHIYKDFNFLYGPLLLYFPIAVQFLLRPFHAGAQAAYTVALAIMQLLGILLLYFTLEALPLSRRLKTLTLGTFTIATLCPLFGLNYTLVRSLLPFSTLLFATRLQRPLALAALFFLGELLQLAVSPELGVAFAAGALVFALCRAIARGPAYLPALIATPLAVGAFLAIAGKQYLDSISKFSSGCLNLVVEPLPYMLLFLFALVWLVPRMLGRMAKEGAPETILMIALFVASIALVPPALGRCDPLHVFFNGAGIYLLAIVAISAYPLKARDLWIFGIQLTLVWMQGVNLVIFRGSILSAARAVDPEDSAKAREIAYMRGVTDIQQIVGHGKLSVPFRVPLYVEEELKRDGIYQPDRDCFYIGVWDTESETARVARMNQTEWALIQTTDQGWSETAQSTELILGFGFDYPRRRQPFVYGQLILTDLATHWTKVTQSPDWILYRNNRFPRSNDFSTQMRHPESQ